MSGRTLHDNLLPTVRTAVRDVLVSAPAYHALPLEERRKLAGLMVEVCQTAAGLLAEEIESKEQARFAALEAPPAPASNRQEMARTLNAGDEFSGVAVNRVADTARGIMNAISFPRFVTELINGVFKAMQDTNVQQMQSFVQLLGDVSSTLEGFRDANVGDMQARQWLVDTFPGTFTIDQDADEVAEQRKLPPEEREPVPAQLRLSPGASMPSEAALRTRFGLPDDASVPTGDPERVLVPMARSRMAGQRQQMLATMVMLGMQRIVIDSGRIQAAMRFHIDASSAAQQDRGNSFDFRNTINAAGSFSAGLWGASAAMANTIGYASTEQTTTRENLNAEVDVNSSVDIVFHTDYLPLNTITTQAQADRIRSNSLNPQAEIAAASAARETRRTDAAASEQRGRDLIRGRLEAAPNLTPSQIPQVRYKEDVLAGKSPGFIPTTAAPSQSNTQSPNPTAAPSQSNTQSPNPTAAPSQSNTQSPNPTAQASKAQIQPTQSAP